MGLQGSHILVTGGAGFIGSHLVEQLTEEGARVRILDSLLTGDRRNVSPDVEFIQGDIRDESTVKKALQNIDIVFHLAAQINPAKAVEDPMFDFDINVNGSLILLLASRAASVHKFIMASTNVYGNADVPLMSETFPTLATRESLLSPYAAAKVAAEAYLKVANDELGLPTIRLRFTNVYGPRQLTKSESGVVAIFAKAALSGKPIHVFGDGEQTRDFVYVSDLVDAMKEAGRNDAANGEALNIGTGSEFSINALATKINQLTGANVPIIHKGERAADFRRVKADISLAREILGYQPRVQLDEGLGYYIQWCRENMDRVG